MFINRDIVVRLKILVWTPCSMLDSLHPPASLTQAWKANWEFYTRKSVQAAQATYQAKQQLQDMFAKAAAYWDDVDDVPDCLTCLDIAIVSQNQFSFWLFIIWIGAIIAALFVANSYLLYVVETVENCKADYHLVKWSVTFAASLKLKFLLVVSQ